jgi:hypothetical protein
MDDCITLVVHKGNAVSYEIGETGDPERPGYTYRRKEGGKNITKRSVVNLLAEPQNREKALEVLVVLYEFKQQTRHPFFGFVPEMLRGLDLRNTIQHVYFPHGVESQEAIEIRQFTEGVSSWVKELIAFLHAYVTRAKTKSAKRSVPNVPPLQPPPFPTERIPM